MQHAAHVWQTYMQQHVQPLTVAPPPARNADDLLAFPKASLQYLGLPDNAVPASSEILDDQVNRLVEAVGDGPGATARVEEIRRNATIVRAYVFTTLDKRSGGWSTTSLDEDETNYTSLEAKKEELERALATMEGGTGTPAYDADRISRKLREITKRRDETKAKYIASLSKEIMKVARAALGRISPEAVASSDGCAATSVASPTSSMLDATAPTAPPPRMGLRQNSSFASFDSALDPFDATYPTDETATDQMGVHVDQLLPADRFELDKLDGLDLGDLLSDAELRHMELSEDTPAQRNADGGGGGGGGFPTGKRKQPFPPLPPIDMSGLAPPKVAVPPSRPTLMSWCSWPTQ